MLESNTSQTALQDNLEFKTRGEFRQEMNRQMDITR